MRGRGDGGRDGNASVRLGLSLAGEGLGILRLWRRGGLLGVGFLLGKLEGVSAGGGRGGVGFLRGD